MTGKQAEIIMEGVEKGTQQLQLGKSSLSKMFYVSLLLFILWKWVVQWAIFNECKYIYLSCSVITVTKIQSQWTDCKIANLTVRSFRHFDMYSVPRLLWIYLRCDYWCKQMVVSVSSIYMILCVLYIYTFTDVAVSLKLNSLRRDIHLSENYVWVSLNKLASLWWHCWQDTNCQLDFNDLSNRLTC